MTKRINVIKAFIYKKILLDFTLKYYYFSNIYPSKPRIKYQSVVELVLNPVAH